MSKETWDQLRLDVRSTFKNLWTSRDGQKVPEPADLGLGNDEVVLDATILYADLADSTPMVRDQSAQFAGEVYKSYLQGAAKMINTFGGNIIGYDGDRIMAVWIGDSKESYAAVTALTIQGLVNEIVQPELDAVYGAGHFDVQQAVGIDSGQVHIARVGVRGDNDLVFIGTAANYAAKFCALREPLYNTFISASTYAALIDVAKFAKDGREMWTADYDLNTNQVIYKSSWYMYYEE